MGGLFSYNSVLSKKLVFVYHLMVGSVLWIVFSIPIVTIGNSTYAASQYFSSEEKSVILFLLAFKKDFLKVLLFTIIYLFVGALAITNIYILHPAFGGINIITILMFFYIAFEIILGNSFFYGLKLIASNKFVLKKIIMSGLYFSCRYFFWSLIIGLLFVTSIIALSFLPVLIVILPGIFLWVVTVIINNNLNKLIKSV